MTLPKQSGRHSVSTAKKPIPLWSFGGAKPAKETDKKMRVLTSGTSVKMRFHVDTSNLEGLDPLKVRLIEGTSGFWVLALQGVSVSFGWF